MGLWVGNLRGLGGEKLVSLCVGDQARSGSLSLAVFRRFGMVTTCRVDVAPIVLTGQFK
jgi:hypothetical protein